MKHRLRLILTFLFRGPGAIGDVNLQYVPMPLMLIWFGCMRLWYCVPVVSRRMRYQELKNEADGAQYWIKYMKQAREEAKEYKAFKEEYEYELRQLGQFDTILRVKAKIADKDTYDYPHRNYTDDYSYEPRSTVSSPVMNFRR